MKRVLVSCLIAAMFTGLVACGNNGATTDGTNGSETVTTSDSDANAEDQADTDNGEKAKDNKGGSGFVGQSSELNYDKMIIDYNDISDEVRNGMKECAKAQVKEYLDENTSTYENVGDLNYEGLIFQVNDTPEGGKASDVFLFFSTTGTKLDGLSGEKKEMDLCFYVTLVHICPVDDKSYGCAEVHVQENENIRAEFLYTKSQMLTFYHTFMVDKKKNGYVDEAFDGFEKYGDYKAATKVADMEKAPFFETMKQVGANNIDKYMADNFGENISYTEPEYVGTFIREDKDKEERTETHIIYKIVFSDADGLCEDTELFFDEGFEETCFTVDGELLYYESCEEPYGHMYLGDSAYEVRAYDSIGKIGKLYDDDGSLQEAVLDKSETLSVN